MIVTPLPPDEIQRGVNRYCAAKGWTVQDLLNHENVRFHLKQAIGVAVSLKLASVKDNLELNAIEMILSSGTAIEEGVSTHQHRV